MNTRGFYLLSFILILAFFSCDQETNSAETVTTNVIATDTLIVPKLEGLKPKLRLTPKAEEVTKNWKFYQEVSAILDSLGKGNLSQTRALVTRLDKAYINQAKSTEADVNLRPSEVNTQPIKARLAALETQIKVLQNEVSRNEPSVDRIAFSIVKSKNAFQDLNLQIDERFALSIEEMLKAANELPDSLVTRSLEPSSAPKPQ